MASDKLAIDHVSKTFSNGQHVLDDISLSVKNGEFVSIIGPSGCGKSTLFTLLAGVEQQSQGRIALNGKTAIKRAGKFGYMPQSPLLLPWRTVVQNVTLGLDIKKTDPTVAKEKATQLLEQFGLAKFANAYPATLSGGMKQRVALLRTILFHQGLLLLDEPFGALDALTRLSCQQWLLEIKKELKPTILFITHDVREAIFLSDTIYVLSPAPASIRAKFAVDLPQKRSLKHLSTQKALALEQKILSYLIANTNL